jgi:hypothetical protein
MFSLDVIRLNDELKTKDDRANVARHVLREDIHRKNLRQSPQDEKNCFGLHDIKTHHCQD